MLQHYILKFFSFSLEITSHLCKKTRDYIIIKDQYIIN